MPDPTRSTLARRALGSATRSRRVLGLRVYALDALALVAFAVAALALARARVEPPGLEALRAETGRAASWSERGGVLRFRLEGLAGSFTLSPRESAGVLELRRALEQGAELTVWVEPGGDRRGALLSVGPEAWQIGAGERVLAPYAEIAREHRRQARIGRWLGLALLAAGLFLIVVPRTPARAELERERRRGSGRSGRGVEVGTALLLAATGVALGVAALTPPPGREELIERRGRVARVDLKQSEGRPNALSVQLEGEAQRFVLFRAAAERFETVAGEVRPGVEVTLLTRSDADLAARNPVARVFAKPRVWGLEMDGRLLQRYERTRAHAGGEAPVLGLAALALIGFALATIRRALRRPRPSSSAGSPSPRARPIE